MEYQYYKIIILPLGVQSFLDILLKKGEKYPRDVKLRGQNKLETPCTKKRGTQQQINHNIEN